METIEADSLGVDLAPRLEVVKVVQEQGTDDLQDDRTLSSVLDSS